MLDVQVGASLRGQGIPRIRSASSLQGRTRSSVDSAEAPDVDVITHTSLESGSGHPAGRALRGRAWPTGTSPPCTLREPDLRQQPSGRKGTAREGLADGHFAALHLTRA